MNSCSPVPRLNCQVIHIFMPFIICHDGFCYVSVAVKTQIDCKSISRYIDIHKVSYTHVCIHLATKKELQVTRMRLNEASEKLMEKNRQYQKLQVKLY